MAFVVTSKFFDCLPLHRLVNIFGRSGLTIVRSTMCQRRHDAAEIGRPVYDLMCRRTERGPRIGHDALPTMTAVAAKMAKWQ